MPAVLCLVCAKRVAMPVSWKFSTYTCPHCSHTFKVRWSAFRRLRPFTVPVTATTAAEVERIVPILNAALGIRVSREEFFALALAALVEKYDAGAMKSDDTSEVVVPNPRPGVRGGEETGVSETTEQAIQPGRVR